MDGSDYSKVFLVFGALVCTEFWSWVEWSQCIKVSSFVILEEDDTKILWLFLLYFVCTYGWNGVSPCGLWQGWRGWNLGVLAMQISGSCILKAL